MITLLFSMLGPRLTDAQEAQFSELARWVVLSERGVKLLVDGIGSQEHVAIVFAALDAAGRSPKAIGAWNEDGTPVEGFPLDVAEWLEVAPDDVSEGEDGEVILTRPSEWRDLHTWAGWAPKSPGS